MKKENKIKRRNFFFYMSAAAIGAAAVVKFPFTGLLRKAAQSSSASSSIRVTENPNAIKRTGKGTVNG